MRREALIPAGLPWELSVTAERPVDQQPAGTGRGMGRSTDEAKDEDDGGIDGVCSGDEEEGEWRDG